MPEGDRIALVTGAGGDIGKALCRRLQSAGLAVVGWDIASPPDDIDLLDWQVVDLSGDEVPTDAAERLVTAGRLKAIFHVVGGSDVEELSTKDLAKVPLSALRRSVGLNLFSAFSVIQATVDQLREADGDRSYTLVSSTNAYGGYRAPGYSAAKAALHGLVQALAAPLGADGIRINAVALGTTETENYRRIARELGREANFSRIGAKIPRGRVLSPDEAASALVAVGLDNPAVTGTITIADAAQSLVRP
ncbi:SDR family NAD(P)-dependent oxidoreductase [Actinoplanes sp. NPDC020271]|uniref:SDR family NAD(P)-dependent oxidoreductase n=1 Tax=Actinoplanes sp. NPDC020271 TaxID=3363896 RepID=UPI00379BD8C4